MKPVKAMYAFSGDPITFGHIHIIERASKLFEHLVVGIGMNPAKKYLFTLEERLAIAQQALSHYGNIEVVLFRGLLVDYAFEHNISVIIRGLRNSEDFNMELLLHQIGESQKANIETIYFPSSQHMSHISSGAVKALQLEQGFVFDYVPLNVKQKLEEKLSGQFIIGVTGEIAVGKSHLCKQLQALGKREQIPVTVIDIDKIGHQILESQDEPLYQGIRNEIAARFGEEIREENGFINRKRLGRIIFEDRDKLKEFNDIIYKPLLLKLRRELYGKKGLILLDSALIAESNMTYLCNNQVIVVNADKAAQLQRLNNRAYTPQQIAQRMNSQYSHDLKLKAIRHLIDRDHYGTILAFDSDSPDYEGRLSALLADIGKGLAKTKEIL